MCLNSPKLRALAVLALKGLGSRLLKDPDNRHVLEGRSFEVRAGAARPVCPAERSSASGIITQCSRVALTHARPMYFRTS